ncbi:hypothetical protein [Paenibacillus sp. HB172176]|uniref:hypothetical protein n=1 Tax=Paenibacillus sp. HB172176 TaxID=2493690 RepID=UPI00143AE926|nr:hypothetical protein [Paenibacillus sp. HB172176]
MTKHHEPVQPESKSTSSFLFQVEILIEEKHHTSALEQLIHQLNSNDFSDYRITSGIQLGEKIERALYAAEVHESVPISIEKDAATEHLTKIETKTASPPKPMSEPKAPEEPKAQGDSQSLDPIRTFMKNNSLIRLIVNRGFGVKMNIPCRIINIDDNDQLITVYHVDEKQVYTFRLNEIEDFVL